MNRIIVVLIVFLITFISCEKDDICIDDTTPKLQLRFYDFDNLSIVKPVSSLTVWALNKDSLYVDNSIDSIALPLKLSEDITNYVFSNGTLSDTITFGYFRNDVFVSRSCGYKTNFNDLLIISNTANWIKDIQVKNSTIKNDTAAHVTIYH